MTDPTNPPPAVGDLVKSKAGLLVDEGPFDGRVVTVADDGIVTAEFRQWPHPPMVVTGPAEDFTVVHRFATDGPTWNDFFAEIAEEFWKLAPPSFAEAAHNDLGFSVCHQNLMIAVRDAVDAAWARWESKVAAGKEAAA